MLNSFLQFLEQDDSQSMLVATSNLPDLLDRALYRRFDATVRYTMPTAAISNKVIRSRLAAFDLTDVNWRRVGPAAKGLSHAESTAAAELAAKEAILAGSTTVTTEGILDALEIRRSADLMST